MTSLKTIAATAIIAVAGTVAAFGGLHMGQSSADATTAQPSARAQKTYTVTLSAQQLARLMRGQRNAGSQALVRHAQHQRQATQHATFRNATRSTRGSVSHYSRQGVYRNGSPCYGYSHSGDCRSSDGHSGGGCGDGGCR
jgi:hypothetical protein